MHQLHPFTIIRARRTRLGLFPVYVRYHWMGKACPPRAWVLGSNGSFVARLLCGVLAVLGCFALQVAFFLVNPDRLVHGLEFAFSQIGWFGDCDIRFGSVVFRSCFFSSLHTLSSDLHLHPSRYSPFSFSGLAPDCPPAFRCVREWRSGQRHNFHSPEECHSIPAACFWQTAWWRADRSPAI